MSLNQKITKSLLKIQATQLTEVEVKAISLVTHGANQAPFKVLKSEDIDSQQMEEVNMSIDIGSWFTKFKSPDAEEVKLPLVATIAIKADGENVNELKEAIKAQGFNVDDTEEVEGALIMKQVDNVDVATLTHYKSNEDIMIGVANVVKSFDPWSSSTSFSENLQKNSFLPGLSLAAGVMQETAFEILVSADKSDDFKELLEKSVADFSAHVISLAANIPTAAFKLESIKVVVKEEVKVVTEKSEKNKDLTKDAATVKVNKEDVAKAADLPKEPKTEDVVSGTENMNIGNLMDTATEQLTKTMDAMAVKFSETSETLNASIKGIGERLEKLEGDTKANAKKAEDDLNNAVLGSGVNYDMASSPQGNVEVFKTNDKAEYPESLWENAINTD